MSVDHSFGKTILLADLRPRERNGPKARKRDCAPALMRGEAQRTDVRAGV